MKEEPRSRTLIYILIGIVFLISIFNIHIDVKEEIEEEYIYSNGTKFFTLRESQEDNFKGLFCEEDMKWDYSYGGKINIFIAELLK
jgi:hypothetical protein